MNKYATIVLWLGLAMILLQFIKSWPEIRAVLFSSGISRQGDTFGNPPTNVNPGANGKCPPGYSPQAGPGGTTICRLHSRLPL